MNDKINQTIEFMAGNPKNNYKFKKQDLITLNMSGKLN